jgi:outer membrane protein TolC
VIGGQIMATLLNFYLVPSLFRVLYGRINPFHTSSPAASGRGSMDPRQGHSGMTALLLVICLAAVAHSAQPREVSVPEVLRQAEAASPDLKAALQREQVAERNISIFKSFYYPIFAAEAIDSFGFPGSSRDLGLSGLMSSPYRSGPTGGMVGDLTLYDPARHYALQTARDDLKAIQERTKITRYGVDQFVLSVYLDASRFRGQEESYLAVAGYVTEVAGQVEMFVKTGQRSVVDRLLVQDQVTEAQMSAAGFKERYLVALRRMALETGMAQENLACPTPAGLGESSLGIQETGAGSPLITQASANAQAAHTSIGIYSSRNLPKLQATASVGDMDTARLVGKKDYSGGFGFSLPLFEGYRITSQVHQAEALAAQRDQDLNAVRLQVDEMNAHYDETINASRVQLEYLQRELDVAQRAFDLAKKRYYNFQGTLVDVREAVRNLERIQSEVIDVKADLLLAVGSKALLNGAVVH